MELSHMPATALPKELTPAEQARMVAALHAALQGCHPPGTVERIETHISHVLVTPEHAYKLKKAVNPGFLDFTTCARRLHFCLEELRLNRRLAPALYLDVTPITGSIDAPVLGGVGAPIDHAVHMRAFAQDGLWDRMALRGALNAQQIDELAATLHAFHVAAAVAPAGSRFGEPEQVRAPMLDNLDALDALLTDPQDRAHLAALRQWEAATFETLRPVFAQRRRDGHVRECHGDLHLRNVAQIDGRTTVFDCIEFNDDFRWIDTMSEIAFMAMDLQAHGLPALAHRFVDACLQQGGDHAGLRVMGYYVAHRALVRAKVAALRAAQPGAVAGDAAAVRLGVDLALAESRARPLALIITHGLSGSGKTTQTQQLLEATGAIRVRADVERKRLAGLPWQARSGSALQAGLYTADATAATYARLVEIAREVLRAGRPVVLDATFLQRAQRDRARAIAAEAGVPFVILDLEVDLATLRERVRRRQAAGTDASEADLAVLDTQWRTREPLDADERGACVTDWTALRQRWMLGPAPD